MKVPAVTSLFSARGTRLSSLRYIELKKRRTEFLRTTANEINKNNLALSAVLGRFCTQFTDNHTDNFRVDHFWPFCSCGHSNPHFPVIFRIKLARSGSMSLSSPGRFIE